MTSNPLRRIAGGATAGAALVAALVAGAVNAALAPVVGLVLVVGSGVALLALAGDRVRRAVRRD